MTNPYMFGSDWDSMAGLASNPAKTRFALARQAMALHAAGQALVRPVRPTPMARPAPQMNDLAEAFEQARGNEALFGMDSGAVLVAGGAGGTVFTAPQKPCIPTRMVLSDTVANNFTLSNLSVGVEPVLLTNGTNISLAAFTPQSTAAEFRAVLCHVGNTISAVITNLSATPARFLATIYAVPWLVGPAYA